MKLFLRKILIFTIPVILIYYVEPVYLLLDEKYKHIVAGQEIYRSIRKSKKESNKKILVIGDSAGKQLFDNYDEDNDSINSLACNQAIGVIGQYFLLNNYLEKGNKPQEVYMIYTPFSFRNNLNQIYTFHYFLKPFFKKEYLPLFTSYAINQVKKIPYAIFSQEPHILTSNWAPEFRPSDIMDYTFLSPISKEYIEKIKMLCITHDIEFYILPTPTKASNKNEILGYNKKESANLLAEKELNYFIDNVNYYPDSIFIDNTHLKYPNKLKKTLINEMNKVRKTTSIDNR